MNLNFDIVKIKKKETDPHVLLERKLQKRNEKKMKKVSIDNVSDDEFKKLYFFDKDIVKTLHVKLLQVNRKIKEEYILWAISYLYFKHSHEKKALEYGVSRRTYQCRVWDVFRAISSLQPTRSILDRKSTSIKINSEYNGSNDEDGYISLILDVAFFPFSNREAQYFGKKGPGLSYEIGFSPKDGEILYLNGPFPAAYENIMIFREGYLYDIDFEKGEMVIGTKHHRGEPDKIMTPHLEPSSNREKEYNKWINSKRIVADKVMGVIKHFKLSQTGWSSSVEKHQLAVSFLLYAINLSIIKDNGPDLLDKTREKNSDLFFNDLKEFRELNSIKKHQHHNQHHDNNDESLQYYYDEDDQFASLQKQPYNNNEYSQKYSNNLNFKNQHLNTSIYNNFNKYHQYNNSYHDNDDQVPTIDEDESDDGHFTDSDSESIDNHSSETLDHPDSIYSSKHPIKKPMFFCFSNRTNIEKA